MASWGPWFLWALFAAILVWEEVWDLPNTAYLSAWLLLIITAGELYSAPCLSSLQIGCPLFIKSIKSTWGFAKCGVTLTQRARP